LSEEIAKLALECLKTRLETSKIDSETRLEQAKATKTLLESLPWEELRSLLPMILPEGQGQLKRPPALTLDRRDLLFFASKCSLTLLRDIIRDMQNVLKEREGSVTKEEE